VSARFVDLAKTHQELRNDLEHALDAVLESGIHILGPQLEAFEREFAEVCGARHCIGVGNGFDALALGLRAFGIGAGDEVLVPSHTFIATWLAVTHVGATPVPVEPDPATYNLDPDRLEAAITPRTRAVVPVHLYGRLAPMAEIGAIARQHDLRVIEDAAQAHGARADGLLAGGAGDVAAFSFYPIKNLGALGDGGALTTDDDGLAQRLRLLRNYGSRERDVHELLGVNSRLDELQAAFLRVKLERLEEDNSHRRAVATSYLDAFAGGPVALPPRDERGRESAWHLFVVRTSQRDALREHLESRGVATAVHYPRAPHLQPCYAGLGIVRGSLPVAEQLQHEVVSLPVGTHLGQDDVDAIVDAVKSWAPAPR
jgi:dTDP-4-amino-4,6-dideoxygalactose transaminase